MTSPIPNGRRVSNMTGIVGLVLLLVQLSQAARARGRVPFTVNPLACIGPP